MADLVAPLIEGEPEQGLLQRLKGIPERFKAMLRSSAFAATCQVLAWVKSHVPALNLAVLGRGYVRGSSRERVSELMVEAHLIAKDLVLQMRV